MARPTAAAAPVDAFATTLRPILQAHCVSCHNPTKRVGGVDLTPFENESAVLKDHKLWRRVIEQVETEQMPPDDEKFTAAMGTTLVSGLKQTLALLDQGHPSLLDPGPSLVRRLSHVEYRNAIRDLTGVDLDVAQRVGLPQDSTGSSYENIAAALLVQPTLLEKYFTAADLVLDRLFGPLPTAPKTKPAWQSDAEIKKQQQQRDAFFAMVPETADRATTQAFLARFTRRAWRRPIAATELDRLLKIYDAALAQGDAPRTALRRTLKPILVAPDFLFRIEADRTPVAPAPGTIVAAARVSDVELASRLSYFLWSSMPDDELFALARQGTLQQPEVLRAQLTRMLADPKISRFMESFPRQWLQLHRVGQFPPDASLYPDYDKWLEQSLVLETTGYFGEVFSKNLPLREFLVSDWTMMNPRLAMHYGLPRPAASGIQRMLLRAEDHRGGLLTHASILSLTSDGTRHRPVHRGVWVSEAIFGRTPPPPPPGSCRRGSRLTARVRPSSSPGPRRTSSTSRSTA